MDVVKILEKIGSISNLLGGKGFGTVAKTFRWKISYSDMSWNNCHKKIRHFSLSFAILCNGRILPEAWSSEKRVTGELRQDVVGLGLFEELIGGQQRQLSPVAAMLNPFD